MKMSITRALAEVKRLDDRIQRAISTGVYVGVTVGKNQNQKMAEGNKTISEVTADIKGSFDQVKQLMKNREVIKAAIVMSNATTKVKVGGKEYTVAEAIELKKTVVSKEYFLNSLRQVNARANLQVNALEGKMKESIERSVMAVYASDKGSKVSADQYDAIAKPQEERFAPALLDPCGITQMIAQLDEEISVINSELDFVLSESNARTDIEVEV